MIQKRRIVYLKEKKDELKAKKEEDNKDWKTD